MAEQKSLDTQMWNALRDPDIKKAFKGLVEALDLGANPNAVYTDHHGDTWTPLSYITDNLHVSSPDFNYQERMVTLLVDRGANINVRCTGHNMTPLMSAVDWDAFNIVKFLLNNGANVNDIWHYEFIDRVFGRDISRGWDNRSVLGFARTPKMLKLLLEHGANPDKGSTETGDYPLHMVCEWLAYTNAPDEPLQMLKLLLEYGANPNVYTLKLLTPMMIICGATDKDMYKASSDTKLAVIKLLFEHGANINADSYGRTALWFAARSEDWSVVKSLAFNGGVMSIGHVSGLSEEIKQRALAIIKDVDEYKEEQRRQEALKAKTTWHSISEQKIADLQQEKMADLQQGQKIVDAMGKAKIGNIHKLDKRFM